MKERLTITLDSELLKKLDGTIDGFNIRNRSHAIERILDITLSQSAPKKAVVLAGGDTIILGKQKDLPKSMVMVKDKPLLEYVIKELKRNDITDIYILMGRGGERISSYFGDGTLFGVKLNYIKEESPKGTEGALHLVKGLVGNAPFFVVNGDNIVRINLMDMYKQHVSTSALATIALSTSTIVASPGVTRLDGFRISSFVEKPTGKGSERNLVSAGVYLFSPSIFNVLNPGSRAAMLERDLFPRLVSASNLYGYVFSTPFGSLDTKSIPDSTKKLERIVDEIGV